MMQNLTHEPALGHITTFGGNPVCCASSLATLEVIEEENILTDVEVKGMLFEKLLKHPAIKEIRRAGLMLAIDLGSAEQVNEVVKYSMDEGVICYWFLSNPYSLRIAPPLTINEREITESCQVILRALDKLS
jgi:acetylornithine/succinyldiaminopimelate/putrescine aminotransferase